MLRYVCNSRSVPDHWYPKDPRKRAQVDLFFDRFQPAVKSIAAYLYQKYPNSPMKVPTVEDPTKLLEKNLGELKRTFLSNRKFLAGDEISLADIQMIFMFSYLDRAEYDLSKHPILKEWKERILTTDVKQQYNKYLEKSTKVFAEALKAADEAAAKAQGK